ncbi:MULTISPECIES: DUF948 domain-containing protein [Bacillaceae]|uniref:DUF948 domain-containing protein n=1 Tax=Evansella alkalicola TaxID=745819 RepID=A0ABS6JWQ9_9BACI|nr:MULTISPECIES: DUF948 domain-containing protein [Bacillaceae]MBU9722830.1 DUF948 domain-containing protein [Bacillus alkalicola]
MDWLGIGVFILSLGFAVGVISLIPVLNKLASTLGATAVTIEKTHKTIDDLTGETKLMLQQTNETIADLNNKMAKLDPLFQIVHDTGESAHHLTSSLVRITGAKADHVHTGTEILDRNKLQGLVRGAAFIYYLKQAKNQMDRTK